MKRRVARSSACERTGKRRYRDEASAKHAISRARKYPGRAKPTRYYCCEFCGGWHLTSRKERR